MANFNTRTGATNNDGDKRINGSSPTSWSNGSGNVRVGRETAFLGDGTFIHGVRFTGVTVPQGVTISSATLTYTALGSDSNNVLAKVFGIAEDNTSDFSSDPAGRSKTSASNDFDVNGVTNNATYSVDITAIVQEIINRAGWSSGNAMGFLVEDDGSGVGQKHTYQSHDGVSGSAPLLDINYTTKSPSLSPSSSISPSVSPSSSNSPSTSLSPSASISPSSSQSLSLSISPSSSVSPSESMSASVSLSQSPSASLSSSSSLSPSTSLSPSVEFVQEPMIIAVAKRGKNVLDADSPNDFVFHSQFNGFKIIKEETVALTVLAGTLNQTFTVPHGLNFTPLVRAFAKEDGVQRVFTPNYYDISLWGATIGMTSSGIQFNYITSDATNVYFNFSSTSVSNKTIYVRYFLLEDIAILPGTPQHGIQQERHKIVVAKPGFDAKRETNPRNLKFSSDYGTLKYFQKVNSIITFTAGLTISGRNIITHNLGYYPYVEAFVRTYIGSPSGDFEPAPFYGAGISVLYNASLIIKPNTIEIYGEVNGVTSDTWNFEFLLFIYKNNLQL